MFQFGLLAISILLLAIIPIFVAFVNPTKKAIQTLLALTIIFALLGFGFVNGYLKYNFDTNQYLINRNIWIGEFTFYVIITSGIIYIVHLYRETINQNFHKIEHQNAELKQHQEELESLVLEKTRHLDSANLLLTEKNEELEQTLIELKLTQARMIQSDKMASLGVMANGIAHEINNPLNYIMGAYEGLKELESDNMLNDKESLELLLAGFKSGLDKTTAIVHRLNRFAVTDPEKSSKSMTREIVENCIEMITPSLNTTTAIHKNFSQSEEFVTGDINGFHQVFLNILSNAKDALEDKHDAEIRITTFTVGDDVVVEISDNGEGIEQSHLDKITDPFFTTKDPGKGTGLGLFVAYSIVSEHGGRLEIYSTIGKGTTVRVSLKRHE